MSEKYRVIIQCDESLKRCSGYACMASFYDKSGKFADADPDSRYISFSCGGCPGKGVNTKLSHLTKKLKKKESLGREEVIVHLSSCMTTDNHHFDRCPHVDYIKKIIAKMGYETVVEGSYISGGAEKKRDAGIYKRY